MRCEDRAVATRCDGRCARVAKSMPRPARTAGQGLLLLRRLLDFCSTFWWPAFAGYGEWNTRLQQGTVALCREWQDFLGRRIAEDVALVQRLGTARSPEQVWAAYVPSGRRRPPTTIRRSVGAQ